MSPRSCTRVDQERRLGGTGMAREKFDLVKEELALPPVDHALGLPCGGGGWGEGDYSCERFKKARHGKEAARGNKCQEVREGRVNLRCQLRECTVLAAHPLQSSPCYCYNKDDVDQTPGILGYRGEEWEGRWTPRRRRYGMRGAPGRGNDRRRMEAITGSSGAT